MIHPLTLSATAARNFASGALTRVRRPADGRSAALTPGDLVWICEPFHLPVKFDKLAPTAAVRRGATAHFAAQLMPEEAARLGPQRFARALPRALHRMHAHVLAVEEQPLQAITLAEARAEGFATILEFAAQWDHALKAFRGRGAFWADNPAVRVLTLDPIRSPLPPVTLPPVILQKEPA